MAKLVVVDDTPDNVKLLSLELIDLGHEVTVAYSGIEALEAVHTECPDCILLDSMLPDMDGLEVCRRLKTDANTRMIPVIIVSGRNNDEDMIRVLDAGADDYVSKPFNIRIVEARVQSILRTKRIQDELTEINQQLNEMRLAAENANQSKSEFLANMSHEIRTPMTAILGFTEVLGDNVQKDENLAIVDIIRRNGEYLLELLNDILELSKIEAGKVAIEQIPCDPAELITDVIALMQVRSEEKNLPLRVEYDGDIPENILTDPTRVRQILINLLGNAIKFTEQGEVRLRVGLIDTDGTAPHFKFDVIDTGIGMSEEQIGKLFRPFTQADMSTNRKYGGTGLGLTISKHFTEMLGGNVTISSVAGKGSTFSVTIPTGLLQDYKVIDRNAEQQSNKTQPVKKKAKTQPTIQLDCKILLAEDGIDNQRLITFVLTKAGAEVTLADNGRIAVELASKARQDGNPFDIILMDMQMPEMDGYEATRFLRDQGDPSPIIALTANAMTGDRTKCLHAGCDVYLSKPINRGLLLENVKNLSESSKQLENIATPANS